MKNILNLLAETLLFVVLTCGSAESITIRVPSEQPTIQEGIDAAVTGDTVLVADGTYFGVLNKNLDFCGKDIVVISENGAQTTVINCSNNGRGFDFHSGESNAALVDGFTIMNGFAKIVDKGGGIYCSNSSPTISNCIIKDNLTDQYGGGIYCGDYSVIIRCDIRDNRAGVVAGCCGGGIYCGGFSTVIDCNISGNDAQGEQGYGSGGGVYCFDNSTILNCSIIDNGAFFYYGSGRGGGIMASEAATIEKCSIINNRTDGSGGGIISFGASVMITNCIIHSNWAGGSGGGLSISSNVRNCIITSNGAGDYGGGISGSGNVSNCSIIGNSAGDGGGIDSWFGTFTNCIVWDNSPNEISGHPIVTITYSDIEGGYEGEGNIDSDPFFTNVPWFGFSYLLRPSSPCIDTGDPSIEDGIHDSDPRCPSWYSNGSRSDMGAYGGPGNGGWVN